MKNIHVLSTDKPSKLHYFTANKAGYYLYPNNELVIPNNPNCINQNIYITSDEEIKEGDAYITKHGEICKSHNGSKIILFKTDRKIILTTDQDLIKDGVQAIDDEFLEWFVKNPSCESVRTILEKEYGEYETGGGLSRFRGFEMKYKVIIPKEEPFKHEVKVLSKEEVMEGRSSAYKFIDFDKQETLQGKLQSLVVKWHQLQLHYQDVADDNITHEHTNRKFTYKAQATRDCWKELLTLLNESKNE